MEYNLSPFYNALSLNNPNYDNWIQKFDKFFSLEQAEPALYDEWYNHLIEDNYRVKEILRLGYLVDSYTAIATFDDPFVGTRNSFNMAHYIQRTYDRFIRKNVLTMIGDYGVTNIQLQLCGVNIVSSNMKLENVTGSMLTTILNEGYPYPINRQEHEKEDIVIACSIFDYDNEAWNNWQGLLDRRADGTEVYFTSSKNCSLKKFVNYDIIDLIESPLDVYEVSDLDDLKYGYTHKLYRLK
jgi:hypothetical protein